MPLLRPVTIHDNCKTKSLNFTPTDKYLKPVIVMSGPLSVETAETIGAAHMFDGQGNPRPLQGTYGLPLALPSAQLIITSQIHGARTIRCEKVTSFRLYIVEKTGMFFDVRCHLPEPKNDGQIKDQNELQAFLGQMNKSPYSIEISDQQLALGLVPAGEQQSDDGPLTGDDVTTVSKRVGKGKSTTLHATISHAIVGDSYVAGWACKCPGFKANDFGAVAPRRDGRKFPKVDEAITWAASELMFFLKQVPADGKVEMEAIGEGIDWCIEMAPSLDRSEKETAPSDAEPVTS